ncbi:MarR family transcriptional regulator [Reichenbachiella agarivorans]|uniref:MarR family transcriptional regulator n=1 Tax=Reichenbachiella agarivorans TaxID=2979464 RepID=A0ABY6CPE9_9BACT|nr:MarR family transcriptional regulator [Reichenbachiella agarivorans]UXP31915.1 MarR family transcriptional regulator [Reichenbachiella agarivorans]
MAKKKIIIEDSILSLMGKTMKALHYFIGDSFHSYGIELTRAQFVLLKVLSTHEGIVQNDLAFITNRDKTSLARLLSTMEKKELLRRESSETDKRTNLVHITSKGEEALKMAHPIIKDALKVIQSNISEQELTTTIEVLKKIRKNINADELTMPYQN